MTDSNVNILKYKDQITDFIKSTLDILNTKNDIHISLDFEFDRDFKRNKHVMALAQMMISYIDDNKIHNTPVYLMDLRIFPKKELTTFVDRILLNPKGLKILHGSESLDLPALRDLMNSDQKFKTFLMQMVDTRHLCETHHILSNKYQQTSYKKCNIYSALLNTGVITDEEYRQLSSIKINYNKPWKIHNLTEKQITYAMADAVFLLNLYIAYHSLLGQEMIDMVMNGFRYAVLVKSNIIELKYKNKETRDIIEKLNKLRVLKNVQAESPIGSITIGDLFKIDYSRKALVRLAFELYAT